MKKLFPFSFMLLSLFLVVISPISAYKFETRYFHEQQADHFSQEPFPLLWDQKYKMLNRNSNFVNTTLVIVLCAEGSPDCLLPYFGSIASSNHSLIVLQNREIADNPKLPQSLMQHVLDIELFLKSLIQTNTTQGEYIDPKIILAGEGIYGTIAIIAQNYLNKQAAQRIAGIVGMNSPLNISASNDLWKKSYFSLEEENDEKTNMFNKFNAMTNDSSENKNQTNSTAADNSSSQQQFEQNKDLHANQLIDEIKSSLSEIILSRKQGKQKKQREQKSNQQLPQQGQQKEEKLSKKKNQNASTSLLNDGTMNILLLNERSNLTSGMIENCPNANSLKSKKSKSTQKKKGKLLKQNACVNMNDYTVAEVTEILLATLQRWSEPNQTIKDKKNKNKQKKGQKTKSK